jgi:hypothetical protein
VQRIERSLGAWEAQPHEGIEEIVPIVRARDDFSGRMDAPLVAEPCVVRGHESDRMARLRVRPRLDFARQGIEPSGIAEAPGRKRCEQVGDRREERLLRQGPPFFGAERTETAFGSER